MQQAEKTITALQTKVKQDADELAVLQASSSKTIADLQAQLKDANVLNDQLTKKFTDLTTFAATEKSLADETISGLNAQIAKGVEETNALKKTIVELEGAVDVLKKTVNDITTAKQALESQAKTDAMELSSLKKRIIELESQVNGLTEDCSRAQAEIAGMRKRIAELEGDVKNNLAEIAELQTRITSLERELEVSKVGNKRSSLDKTYPFIT